MWRGNLSNLPAPEVWVDAALVYRETKCWHGRFVKKYVADEGVMRWLRKIQATVTPVLVWVQDRPKGIYEPAVSEEFSRTVEIGGRRLSTVVEIATREGVVEMVTLDPSLVMLHPYIVLWDDDWRRYGRGLRWTLKER